MESNEHQSKNCCIEDKEPMFHQKKYMKERKYKDV